MPTIRVTNLTLVFELVDEELDQGKLEEAVLRYLGSLNKELVNLNLKSRPELVNEGIDEEDIEVFE